MVSSPKRREVRQRISVFSRRDHGHYFYRILLSVVSMLAEPNVESGANM